MLRFNESAEYTVHLTQRCTPLFHIFSVVNTHVHYAEVRIIDIWTHDLREIIV